MPTVVHECVRARFLQQWDSEHPSVPPGGVSALLPSRENKVSGASASLQTTLHRISVLEASFVFWFWVVKKSACFVKIRDLMCEN